jgi:hypothetical protein
VKKSLSALGIGFAVGLTTLAAAAPDHMRADERAAGFVALFDGRTGKGWRGYKQTGFPASGWRIADGVLEHEAGDGKPDGGDLITEEPFENFDLRLEFRLTAGANSGIKYLIVERPGDKSGVGFEYQLLDDDRHPDAANGKPGSRTVGGLFDLVAPPSDKVVRPIGQWNQARIVVDGDRIEHWLNGRRTVAVTRGSPALAALIADSKYKTVPGFGENRRGHILLQDHGDRVAFRNIRVRRLGEPSGRPSK